MFRRIWASDLTLLLVIPITFVLYQILGTYILGLILGILALFVFALQLVVLYRTDVPVNQVKMSHRMLIIAYIIGLVIYAVYKVKVLLLRSHIIQ